MNSISHAYRQFIEPHITPQVQRSPLHPLRSTNCTMSIYNHKHLLPVLKYHGQKMTLSTQLQNQFQSQTLPIRA